MKTSHFVVIFSAFMLFTAAGCGRGQKPQLTSDQLQNAEKSKYVFALVAKSQSNPVFESARFGAEDAAREVGQRLEGVSGISVSCTEAATLTPAINRAVDGGVAVMCFDSDAPESERFCYFGTDDQACGHLIMRELASVLGPGHHVVAIPGGDQNSLNIQNRVNGALAEATNFPNITVRGVYYSKEVPQDAAAQMEQVQTTNPDIDGWAMVGSWALFTDALLKWEPGKIKIVAMDALPAELPYLKEGIVQKLYAQQTYQWGWQSVELLAEKVIQHHSPAVIQYSPLIPVTGTNADEFQANWKKWLHQ
ncbi:MAG: substrate-binding domain-containing protein [Verrucomicrobiota bacterium]